ncbi:uncharacterized protein LOC9635069 isoform X1 [Selaginella moellendorffii]|uniref:uncharacterized protein LOC9635069 isoform X1 n=1 Tax=Selaginella moellendorffii TaxID=88036 RepID=UPI000D1CEEEE|nr:uncharacterized protein LOC9635069 isoform X1 [Selaginella moellendorffii]|eukprot:XP_024520635.1 uncharacterized protein LOC9635069 isoform X1 [Selaginella moellendorffii]
MAATKLWLPAPAPAFGFFYSSLRQRRNVFIMRAADGKVRNAKLAAKRCLTVPFQDSSRLNQFLSEPAGMQILINTNALQSYQKLDDTTYRCCLPKLDILKFEVAPIVDLSIDVKDDECLVKLLSCKFEGSELVEKQNQHFSASMINHLTWGLEKQLNVNVELNVSLEVYTLPFTLLPLQAVETPGSIVLQAMVDRLVPIFLDQLFDGYRKWCLQEVLQPKPRQ